MSYASASPSSGLMQAMPMVRRGLPIVVLATLLLGAAATLLSLRQQPIYEDSAQVFVDTKHVGSSLADVGLSSSEPQRVLDTQAAVARVPAIIVPALAQVSKGLSADDFLDRSSVTADQRADLLTFTVTDPDRRRASRLANAYARSYSAYRRKLDTNALQRAQLQVEERLSALRRGGGASTSLAEDLTARKQELSTRAVLLDSVALLGRPARGAVQVQPHPTRNGVLGAILGLLLGVGVVFVREALNTRVRSASDVAAQLDLPLLGRLRTPSKSARTSHQLAMMTAPSAPEGEAFQLLATNIEFANLDRQLKSFMITSANPAEGKSTTIANLAVTFARSGRHVLLVDLDLRRPVLHRFFGLDSRPGITEVTLGRAVLDEALVEIPLADSASDDLEPAGHGRRPSGRLVLLPAGLLPPNPSEFMRSRALDEVLMDVEDRAEFVFIDAPAMLAVSDAINLTPKTDAVIVVARTPMLRRPALAELGRILDAAPVRKLGFVLTGSGEDDTFVGRYGYTPDEARKGIAPVP